MTQLLADVDGFVGRVGAAPLDVNGLDAIAARAESLSSSLPEVDGCSRASRTSGYSTFLGVEVARLLAATRAQLAAVSTPDLAYLVGLGYRTAAIGTGATWSGAVPLEHALRNELDRRGAAAVAARDTATATLVAVARRQFGVLNPATGPAKRFRAVRGVAVASLSTPTHGRGARPALAWAPVAGAASYRVVLLDRSRRPSWAWQGDSTSVLVGGTSKPVPAGASGPRVAKGSTWSVAAFDASGRPLALSAPARSAPDRVARVQPVTAPGVRPGGAGSGAASAPRIDRT